MEASRDDFALRDLRTAWASGTLTVEDAALRFETILVASGLDHDERSRELPSVVRDLVNRMELIRFTVAKSEQRIRILSLLDEAAITVERQL